MSRNIEQDKKDLKNKANEIYESGKKKAAEFYQDNKDKSESILNTISDAASNLYDDGVQQFHKAEKMIGESKDEVINFIKEKPLTAAVIAGSLGWILSKLTKK